MSVTSRAYANEEDYDRLRRFLVAIQPLVETRLYCTVGDLDWWRWTEDDVEAIRRVRLWCDDGGEVVGFAWPSDRDVQVDLIVHPDHRRLDDEMLAWAEEDRRGRGEPASVLTAWAYDSDEARQATLRQRDYDPAGEYLFLRRRALDGSIAEPQVPAGYTLRQVRGEPDLGRRVAVHRDAFAPSRMSEAKHRAVMRAPTYRPDLDLVVEAPDGSFAAFCIVWFDEANRIGVFEPVGTHSGHRRLGLGRAILGEGMRRLQALGAATAYVSSWHASAAANRLYDSAGLAVVDRNQAWKKSL